MSRITYSNEQVHRSSTDSVIEFDVHVGAHIAWESIRVAKLPDGTIGANPRDIQISARGEGPVVIPAEIMPLVLEEIDRLMSGDDAAPFEPISAAVHVASDADLFTGAIATGARR